MGAGEIDTTALIIAICVIIPAFIAIAVCAIIFFARRRRDRKLNRNTNTSSSSSYEYPHSRERMHPNIYTIDFNRTNRYLPSQGRRSREPPSVIEQPPPSYYHSINRSRFQPVQLNSSIRTTSSSNQIRRSSPVISPSIHSAMPPSYAEIFLTPNSQSDG